ncbi:MAG: hypothetical protein ACI4K7_02275 [Oscillospiraceae bacterium]|nr:hypothetical protein [Oscillospiraceae bacterium]
MARQQGKKFKLFLQEFISNYSLFDKDIQKKMEDISEEASPANIAVTIAAFIKTHNDLNRRVYVLEYQENNIPDEIWEFIYFLSSQRIHNFYMVCTSRSGFDNRENNIADANINYISEDCFRIIVLDSGKIVEDGTYDELIAKEGYFANLVKRQRLDNDKQKATGV